MVMSCGATSDSFSPQHPDVYFLKPEFSLKRKLCLENNFQEAIRQCLVRPRDNQQNRKKERKKKKTHGRHGF